MMHEPGEVENNQVEAVLQLSLLDVLRCSPGEALEVRAAREARFLTLWVQASSEERLQHNAEGDTVLHLIARHDFDGLVRTVLTDESTLASTPNPRERLYPVHLAVEGEENNVAKVLFELDEYSSEHMTYKRNLAMHFAAREGTEATMKLCCDHHKGNIDVLNLHGQSPLACAIQSENAETMDYLRANGAKDSLVDTRGVTNYSMRK